MSQAGLGDTSFEEFVSGSSAHLFTLARLREFSGDAAERGAPDQAHVPGRGGEARGGNGAP